MNGTYADKLRNPRWQQKRLRIMERDGFKCRECGSALETLTVHHHFYERNREPWEYADGDLRTVCEECHRRLEDWLAVARRLLGRLSLAELVNACAVLDLLPFAKFESPPPTPERQRLRDALAAGPSHEEAIALLAEFQAIPG